MGRFPTLGAKEVILVFKKAGFEENRQTGSHLVLKHPTTKRRVVVPMHVGDIKRGTLRQIIKDAGMTEEEFRELL